MSYKKVSKMDYEMIKFIIKDDSRVLYDYNIPAEYNHDELNTVQGNAELVVKVKSTEEVSKVMAFAYKNKIAVTPRGAGTGLVGGAVPVCGGIVIDLSMMNRFLELDEENLTLTVEPGVLLKDIYTYVEAKDLFYPPDPGEKTATIAGNISTNAGGMRAVKYGVTRDYVRGLEVVTAAGDIITIGGKVVKNSSGYSLGNLIVGSEGTLAIITKAMLKLLPLPKEVISMIVPFESLEDAISAVPKIIKSKIVPTAMEFVESEILEDSAEYLGVALPVEKAGAYLILKVDGNSKETMYSEYKKIAEACLKAGAKNVYMADTEERQEQLWTARGSFLKAIHNSTTEMDEVDVVVPRNRIADFVKFTKEVQREVNIRIKSFGHAGDGNLHIYILRDQLDEKMWREKLNKAMELMYNKANEFKGKVSGEHAIGYAKKEYLNEADSFIALAMMRNIKKSLDEKNIMNPGKIIQ